MRGNSSRTRYEGNATATADDGEVRAQAAKANFVRVEADAPMHSVDDRLGLLVNFLLHEVVEFSLHDLGEHESEALNRADGTLLTVGLALAQSVDVQLSFSDMGDAIIRTHLVCSMAAGACEAVMGCGRSWSGMS